MSMSNKEAFELKSQGYILPIVCKKYGNTIWTNKATYEILDEWDCNTYCE